MSEIQSNKYFFFRNATNLSNFGADVHYHSYFEIYCLTDGECNSFVDDKLYNLRLGDVIIIPPGTIHGTHYYSEKHGRVLLNFTLHYVPPSLLELASKEPYLYRCDDTRDEVRRIFAQIEKEYYLSDDYSEEAIRALLSQLIVMILRYAPKTDNINTTSNFIVEAVRYIQSNYQNPISLESVAKSCGVSKVHLSRSFKEKIGIGLNEYISIFRLKKAKELLLTRDKMLVSEIAFDCGFNDSNYFSWLFKKTYGVTPSQYRKNTRV